ncbi:hypothetical protein SEUCBS139899_001890 [Sporothrix eucalyptigena]|uniref:SGNH hydrolase-type esterase domain-containing protein n=1 Tax=Sporothrix eucalyptigena TaxID=1812306 RepID=A0ABP0BYZ4_9PEZI
MVLSGTQPGRSRLRYLLFAALGVIGIVFLWTTTGTDTKQLKEVVSSWPAAVASHFSDADNDSIPSSEVAQGDPANAPYFVLIGDSTTRGQAKDGGGWGDGFLWLLTRGASGVNRGFNGALSTGYFHSPIWEEAIEDIRKMAASRNVYVTIQFGHNDQAPNSNVTLDLYQEALVGMAREVLAAGATPILVTPLARRDFEADGVTVTDNLKDQRERTLLAFQEVLSAQEPDNKPARLINLNAASLAYIGAIGKTASFRYNKFHPFLPDTTHLNELGAIVFGRVVADLILGHPPSLVPSGQKDTWAPGKGNNDDGLSGYIAPDPYMTGLLWHGDAI